MPFKAAYAKIRKFFGARPSSVAIILGLTIAWMTAISWAHYSLNIAVGSVPVVKMGYMPVVTNIAAPLMDAATRDSETLRMEAIKFSSFADMGEALRSGHIQAAFIIAPLSIVLRQQGEDIRVVFIGSRHESTLVGRADLEYTDFSDLAGKTIAVPMRFSGHNLAVLGLAEQYGIRNRIRIVEMNPPDMASALTQGVLDAYCVGEPFAAQTVLSGHAKVLRYVEESWPDFICNLMIMKNSFITKNPEIASDIVQTAIRASLWAGQNIKQAALIVAPYWNQSEALVEYALSNPTHRVKHDRYLPKMEEMQLIAEKMESYNLIRTTDIAGIVDDSLVVKADTGGIRDFGTIRP